MRRTTVPQDELATASLPDQAAMLHRAGTAVAAKAADARIAVSALPAQAAAGENERPDAYVQAPQGLFPAPIQQSELAGGALLACMAPCCKAAGYTARLQEHMLSCSNDQLSHNQRA